MLMSSASAISRLSARHHEVEDLALALVELRRRSERRALRSPRARRRGRARGLAHALDHRACSRRASR
jgi:hypothetical protein